MLTASDPLSVSPQRIVIAGVSGVGKSTLARRIADATGLPYTEIDALFHGPNWVPRESFSADVEQFTAGVRWVTEWQYRPVRAMLSERADTMVWLHLAMPIALWRVVTRTIRRSVTREELWNGNVEPGMWDAVTNREGIIRWAVAGQRKYKLHIPTAEAEYPHLQVVRLRSQREVEQWLAGPLAEAVASTD